jgi:hypothetical protein
MNKFLALLAAVMIATLLISTAWLVGAISVTPANARGEIMLPHPVVHGVIAKATGRACAEEDSVNCFWNARKQGNGRGHSFYSVRVGAQDCIIYWAEKYNRTHGKCYSH